MSQLLSLESFDDIEIDDAVETRSYQDGYDQGYTAGLHAALAEQAALTEECVEALSAIDMTFTEARRQLLDSLQPLLHDLSDKVLPHCVANGFADQIAALIFDTTKQNAGATLTLHVHPSQQAAIAATAQKTTANVIIKTDPSLSPHAAWLAHSGSEALLDMDGLLASIAEILKAISITDDRKPNG
ncbi:hypothetical protein SLH49_00245 [Cognatiyoonia sp. IB215446]|uniref:hypothetical protein n=1 Tax=Cognatiyoonia sp. IB215446 TaxID=3097355 RepID=UPI002A0E5243|nr:hypothetical protein [Cognatiyoonia sp. IB215446]MDX8346404.1 hypothetical protein [Cognatiyoonia sp. IB215446]